MTAPAKQQWAEGMRVVLADGEWEGGPRVAGHYGKVTKVKPSADPDDDDPFIRVVITGHVDGQPPMDFEAADVQWFFPEELTVVD